jgi:hypothetical protein
MGKRGSIGSTDAAIALIWSATRRRTCEGRLLSIRLSRLEQRRTWKPSKSSKKTEKIWNDPNDGADLQRRSATVSAAFQLDVHEEHYTTHLSVRSRMICDVTNDHLTRRERGDECLERARSKH